MPQPSGHDPLSTDRTEGDLNLSPRRRAWQESHLDAETRRWLAEDERVFLRQSLSTPCLNVLRSAGGAWIEDLEGRRYLDFHGNNVHQVGFGHPRILAAIERQLRELSFCTRRYTNIPAIELASELTRLAPGNLKKVLFAPGGTSAMGMALKLARAATGRFKTVSFWDSFHGASLDAISVGGETLFRKGIGPLLPGAEHVPPPEPARCPFHCGSTCNLDCAGYLEYVLEKEGDVAAVVAETVRSTPSIPPPEFWKRVRAACDRHGALLILDEVPHGLGRTGAMFTCEHFGVVPDLLVIGKGLGGGVFPLAALLARADLDAAMPGGALGHYTHEKNPVACAAALETLRVIQDEGLVERARSLGALALEELCKLEARHAIVGGVRGLGLLLGVELVKDRKTRAPAVEEAEQVLYAALSRGLSFKVTLGNLLTLTPALTIEEADLRRAIGILDDCLAQV